MIFFEKNIKTFERKNKVFEKTFTNSKKSVI